MNDKELYEKEDITMSNKFTEEQYLKIIRTYENNSGYDNKATAVIMVVDNFNFDNNLSYNEAFALANPITREWAHEQFVEKEKKYYWSTKKKSKKGKPMTLFKSSGGIAQMTGTKHALTESEIHEWGYNPEMFDKEEAY